MDSIRIKNIGAIKDTGLLNLCGVTLILGESAEGRNLLLRIICFMRWFEEKMCLSSKEDDRTSISGGDLKEQMSKFGVAMEAFGDDSQIYYDGEFINISWIHGHKVYVRIKGCRGGSVPFTGFLPFDRFVDSGCELTELQSTCNEAKAMLEGRIDISMPNLIYDSFCKTENGFVYIHNKIPKSLIGVILPLDSFARIVGDVLGSIGKSSGRDRREIVGCAHLGIEDVDAGMTKGDSFLLVKMLYGMIHECNGKNRRQDKESSIVMSSGWSAEYNTMRMIAGDIDRSHWDGYMSCYHLCDDGMCVRMNLT